MGDRAWEGVEVFSERFCGGCLETIRGAQRASMVAERVLDGDRDGEEERMRVSLLGRTTREDQTNLITANFLRNVIQCLDYPQAQLFALLIFVHDDVFDVAYKPQLVYAVNQSVQSIAPAPSKPFSISPLNSPRTTEAERRRDSQFPLSKNTSCPHYLPLPITHYQYIILISSLCHPIITLCPRLF